MSSSSGARLEEGSAPAFEEEEQQTTRFNAAQLGALVSRSLEKSTMFGVGTPEEAPGIEVVEAPAAAPGFLTKSTAVLVLPDTEPAPPPRASPSPPPEATAPQPLPVPAPLPRRRRRVSTRPIARGGAFRRRLLTLALLCVAVACQPWWWNVGDLRARPLPPTSVAR